MTVREILSNLFANVWRACFDKKGQDRLQFKQLSIRLESVPTYNIYSILRLRIEIFGDIVDYDGLG